MNDQMKHMDYLEDLLVEDLRKIRDKEAEYKGSWKKRGGVGAFMMLARKWDRIEAQLDQTLLDPTSLTSAVGRWDIFAHAKHDERPEGIIDDIRDLRQYLALVETEIINRRIQREQQG